MSYKTVYEIILMHASSVLAPEGLWSPLTTCMLVWQVTTLLIYSHMSAGKMVIVFHCTLTIRFASQCVEIN